MIELSPPAKYSTDRDFERIVVMLVGGPYDGQDIFANRVEVVRGLLVRSEQMYVRSGFDNPWRSSIDVPLFRWLSVCKGPTCYWISEDHKSEAVDAVPSLSRVLQDRRIGMDDDR